MKTLTTLLLCSLGLTLVAAALSATSDETTEQVYEMTPLEVRGITEIPEPIETYCPRISSKCVGAKVMLKFTVNERGRAIGVISEKPLPAYATEAERDLACQMQLAVRNWKFEPAKDSNGRPVPLRVLLPIEVVEKDNKATVLVSLRIDPAEFEPS